MLFILNFMISQMDDKKICQDLEEDEELASLRLAALATLKNRENKKSENVIVSTNNILPINSLTRSNDYSSEHSSRGNQSWRNKDSRRRTGAKHFPKSSQRSNLIVITPVGAENSPPEKNATPQLLLPQHKWCHARNEDSSSPKTDRKTGPTRFNRHDSGSESSDSDYDDSDDSYSNETILQDECSRLTPDESNEDDVELKNGIISERILNFQNFETDSNSDSINKNNIVYSSVKTVPQLDSTHADKQETQSPVQPKTRNNESVCDHYNESTDRVSSPAEKLETPKCENAFQSSSHKSKHPPIMFDVSNKVDSRTRKVSSPNHRDDSAFSPHVFVDLKNNVDEEHKPRELSEIKRLSLSKNDLRFELKKRKNAYAEKSVLPNKQNKAADSKTSSKTKERLNHRSRSPVRSASRERRNYKRSRSRNRSRTSDVKRIRQGTSRFSSSRSRSSSSSSTSSTISSDSSSRLHSVSSVVQPVQSKIVVSDAQNNLKSSVAIKSVLQPESDNLTLRKGKGIEIKLKPISNIKISVPGNDQNNVPEVKKRGPVHMRLGTLPRKRIIQMTKHVEAAFGSSTSSDDDNDVNNKCKSNILVVTEMCGEKMDGISRRVEKKLLKRSDVPKIERGKVLR